jgi:hypothetical protein
MQQFIEKYKDQVLGTLSGFDRLVFRGTLRRLNFSHWDREREIMVATGMERHLWQQGELFKNYGQYVKRVSERIKHHSLKPFREGQIPVKYEQDSKVDKDELARQVAAGKQVRSGLVCAISAMEPSPTFDYIKSRIARRMRPCHVLYHYQVHPELGWMHARIQTWFPFNIQIAINGREWLRQQMDRAGIQYLQVGNCFPWIEDWERAQQLMNQQLETNWPELLQGFVKALNPIHEEIFERCPIEYYWTCYQSEWASDVSFRDADFLKRLMRILVPHGMLSYSSTDVLRYFDQRVNKSGRIPANFGGALQTSFREYLEGERVKYGMESNYLKFYDKAYSELGNLLRAAETTLNQVKMFWTYRPKEGGPKEDLQWRRMRKGVADLNRRAQISQKANDRLLVALASVDDSQRLEELVASIQRPTTWNGRRVRALRPWAEDKDLLQAINDGDFLINGFRNRDLQRLLYSQPAETEAEQRRRSAAVSRRLRMLRAHGVIRKIPHTHRYHVAPDARTMLVAVLTAARTSLNQINELQTKAA